MDVTLTQMLAARDARAVRQDRLNREFRLPILCYSMNIPGPVKDTPLIRRGFLEGLEELDRQLSRVKFRQVIPAITGWEAIFVLDMEPLQAKAIAAKIEDTHDLGRLFDMDVLDINLQKLERSLVGGKSRNCLICGAPGRDCAARRLHSVPELQAAVHSILSTHFATVDARRIGTLAGQALLDEVNTTPKPGLVDRRNIGSHRDMDRSTFLSSIEALLPYFVQCGKIGMDTAHRSPQETFLQLREAGKTAEQAMFAATGGINTHKGAIFSLGILCGAAGRLWSPVSGWQEEPIFFEASAMTAEIMVQELRQGTQPSAGQQLYTKYGIRGIRGEAAEGFPSVQKNALPAFRSYLSAGLSKNDAGARTLLHLISRVEDTCMIHRGGLDSAREAAQKARLLLSADPGPAEIEALDDWFIHRNLSPGGCADLLAVTYFIHSLTQNAPID